MKNNKEYLNIEPRTRQAKAAIEVDEEVLLKTFFFFGQIFSSESVL